VVASTVSTVRINSPRGFENPPQQKKSPERRRRPWLGSCKRESA
jgi:hypothetical protein